MHAILLAAAALSLISARTLAANQDSPGTQSVPAGTLTGNHTASRIGWLSLPSRADVGDVYPRRSELDHVAGDAAMRCGVTADGRLAGCVVVEEDPPGCGFGKAALKLARKFRMSPMTPAGISVAGATVTIPMRFTAPSSN